MNPQTKTALCALLKHSGTASAQALLRRLSGQSFLAVLLLHRVTDDIPEDGLTIGCARFRDLCRRLARGFRVVPLGEIFRLARGGEPLPSRTVAITFDDCYRDNLDAAHVLAEHGLPATFFVPTAFVGTAHLFPWDRDLPAMPNLSWRDVQEMRDLGFEIGSHTVNHADLGVVSADEAAHEILESKAVLEDRLGERIRWLAYPFGTTRNFRGDWLPLLREAGYEGCVSGYGGFIYRGAPTDVLPREPVPCFASNLHLEVHLSGCFDWYHTLKRRLGLTETRQAPWDVEPSRQPLAPSVGERPPLPEWSSSAREDG